MVLSFRRFLVEWQKHWVVAKPMACFRLLRNQGIEQVFEKRLPKVKVTKVKGYEREAVERGKNMAVKLEIAQGMLLQKGAVMPEEQLVLADCYLRVLAESVPADMDFPPFDRSPLDGYAVIAAEVERASEDQPVWLTVVDNIPAGKMPQVGLEPGTAARIMTGAPLPLGATGVVRVEETRSQDGQVAILAGHGVAGNICFQGEEISMGELVLTAGQPINAGAMGLLAMLGKTNVQVYKKPRVGILATGSEVVAVGDPLPGGCIRNSNSYMLSAQVVAAGACPVLLGIAPDDEQEIARYLAQNEVEVIISTGGVSVGDYDYMSRVYRQMGVTILFEQVAIKPGMMVIAGEWQGKMVIGLSGNPAAATIAFELLVRPLLLKMGGRKDWWRPKVKCVLLNDYSKFMGTVRFVWGVCFQQGSALLVEILALQGNGMLKSAIVANCLVVIPQSSQPLNAGCDVEVFLLGPVNGF
jgi:molybdopterin molybdotransferase